MTQVTIGIICYLGLLMYWLLEKPIENSVWSSQHKITSFPTLPNAAPSSNGLTDPNNPYMVVIVASPQFHH